MSDDEIDEMVCGIGLKLPTFSTKSTERWFQCCEAAFRLKKITSSNTKYDHCLSKIDPETFDDVCLTDLENSEDPYGDFKEAVLSRYSLSPEDRVEAALAYEVDDIRSGYQRIKSLLDKSRVPDLHVALTKELLLRSLTDTQRATARAFNSLKIEDFVKAIDDIRRRSTGQKPAGAEITAIGSEKGKKNRICRLHFKFGVKATRCEQPKTCPFGNKNTTPANSNPSSN
ncbi:Hypothetical predicted protein [Paramuricea clavata]|uniref:DUF7041 domain-containing protein n=1 Tax=Paramuricea clavata TaxID=317549 RepID=A0A6S7LV78_PARCT|nr:Hypothetical predicted protein [Paramuricea clavata]